MSARRLEEFIGLIETAERVSGRRDSGPAYPKQVLKSSRFHIMAENYILNGGMNECITNRVNRVFISVHQAVDQHGRVVKTWEAHVDLLEFLAWLCPLGPPPQLTQDLLEPLPLTVASPPSQTSPRPENEKSLPRREVRYHPHQQWTLCAAAS